MNKYVYTLGEFRGSDFLEFRKGNSAAGRKFLRQDSLYVLDNAFFFFLECILQETISAFDMFEDTCVTREEWQEIMHLNISEIVPSEFVKDATKTVSIINRWVTEEIAENEKFVIIGL